MKNRIIGRSYIVVLALVASSAACFQLGSSWLQPATAQIGDGNVKSISGSVSPLLWGLADTQTLRICASGASVTSSFPMITSIAGSSGFVFLERELAVPRDGFSCVDISHAMLVAAGLPTNPPTDDLTFRVIFGAPTRGHGTTAVIAVMNIDAATGHIDLYMNIWLNPPEDRHTQPINIDSFHWRIHSSQIVRVCMIGGSPDVATGSWILDATFINQQGHVVLERELSVPPGEFRCINSSFGDLVAAGLEADPTGVIQFLIDLKVRKSQGRTETVGLFQRETFGAVQSVNVDTGKIDLHQSFKMSSGDR